jgi:hypothetical protein
LERLEALSRDARSRTRHAYDEEVALGVVEGIPEFLTEPEFPLKQLQGRIQA